MSPVPANKNLRTLKGIFSLAVRRNYLAENPFRTIKPVREAQRDHPVLTEDEIHRLLNACPQCALAGVCLPGALNWHAPW